MQFKYPEILYALLLLLIPMFIHLFQLRRFEKVAFTNVAFLKKVELQTRKSSKIKKFLILLSRLGIFAALIIAFAQPFFSNLKQSLKPKTILYLDNSLSMQAKNGASTLFQNTVQDIISNYKSTSNLTILTNDDIYKGLNSKDLKNQLLSLDFTPFPKDISTVLLQASNMFKGDKKFKNNLILISDFQSNITPNKLLLNKDVQYSFVQLKPQINKNISINSAFIAKQDGVNIELKVVIKSHNVARENLSISLYKEKILAGKTSCKLELNKTSTVTFTIPFNDGFNGKFVINDNFLEFDNELFFSLNKLDKIKVLAIGKDNVFLSRIYSNSEFKLTTNNLNQVDYNRISDQHLIVLNELDEVPLSLQKVLVEFIHNGGSVVAIPSDKLNMENYNKLLNSLKIGTITQKKEVELQVNSINFSHSLLNNVFEKRIKNFQYPNVKSVYETLFNNANTILKFENSNSFISENKIKNGKFYWFSAPINSLNSNFKSSPLIVPVFYNFGKQSYQLTQLYYQIGKEVNVNITSNITNDEVLHIEEINESMSANKFIPLQQVSHQKVNLKINDYPLKSGFFQIKKKKKKLKNIAFNYDRSEGIPQYADIEKKLDAYNNASYSINIKDTFEQIESQFTVKSYWKWFLIFAILFLIIEMLLIKFFKNG